MKPLLARLSAAVIAVVLLGGTLFAQGGGLSSGFNQGSYVEITVNDIIVKDGQFTTLLPVMNMDEHGPGSLTKAIPEANVIEGSHIHFNISGSGLKTIDVVYNEVSP